MAKTSQAKRQREKKRREKADAAAKEAAGQMGSALDPTSPEDAALMSQAVNEGWLEEPDAPRFDTSSSGQELAARIAADPSAASIRDLVAVSVLTGLKSKDPRRKGIAERTAIAMDRINQRDEEFKEDLRIKKALLEQKGGHVDESIPTGVVLLERPCTNLDDWQASVAAAEAEQEAGTE